VGLSQVEREAPVYQHGVAQPLTTKPLPEVHPLAVMGPLIAKHRGLLVGGVLLIRTELLPSKNRNRRASTSISCGLFRIEELSLLTKSNQRMRGGARDWLKTISAPRRWWCFSEDCNQSDRARLRYSLPAKKRQTQQRCNEQRVCGRFWHWTSDELQSVHGITYCPEWLEAGAQWVAKQVERQHVTALLTDPQYSTGWVVSQPPALFAVEKTWVNVSVTGSQVPTSIPFQCEIQIVPATSVIPTVSFCTWLVSTLPVAGSSVWIAPLTRDGSK